MKLPLLPVLASALLLAGCTTTSISNSGYRANQYGASGNNTVAYRGELDQWDVLGVNTDTEVTEEAIQNALAEHTTPPLQVGQKLLVIQSGALLPDPEMQEALGEYFSVEPFTGQPDPDDFKAAPLHKRLRLAAARGGIDTLVVYWGLVDSTKEGEVTNSVSWLPFVGQIIPDETKHMRIRLKVAVIDVSTGNWTVLNTEPVSAESISSRMNREASHDKMVLALKREVYQQAAQELREYANRS
ncbi:MAG: aminopeptidase [Verrucomicrobiota bacterium JB022]|nr:aminopeptidase [Verrucomicrobiota bacterium JB022]